MTIIPASETPQSAAATARGHVTRKVVACSSYQHFSNQVEFRQRFPLSTLAHIRVIKYVLLSRALGILVEGG